MKKETRGYKTLVVEAELLASSPERVYQWLEARSGKSSNEPDDNVDVEIEHALLKRKEPLIDLALARFTGEKEIAAELFSRASKAEEDDAAWALRLTVLSNQIFGKTFFTDFPKDLFNSNDECVKWISSATSNELVALFHNPAIDDSFLRDFLDGKDSWKALNDTGQVTAVYALSKNPRMNQAYDGMMDGYAEYSHGAVFNAAWKLAETAPTTRVWATALWELYNILSRESFSMEAPLETAKRWFPSASDEKALKDESSLYHRGLLGPYGVVRSHLADLAISKNSAVANDLLASDDIAFRAAAYRKAHLTPDQIRAAYERDKMLGINYTIYNESLWQSDKTRRILEELSWKAVKDDEHSDMDAANTYKYTRTAMEKKHPKWFADEEFTPEPTKEVADKPATKADVHRVAEAVGIRNDGTEPILITLKQVNASIQGLSKTLGWVWWFSLGALAIMLWRHC